MKTTRKRKMKKAIKRRTSALEKKQEQTLPQVSVSEMVEMWEIETNPFWNVIKDPVSVSRLDPTLIILKITDWVKHEKSLGIEELTEDNYPGVHEYAMEFREQFPHLFVDIWTEESIEQFKPETIAQYLNHQMCEVYGDEPLPWKIEEGHKPFEAFTPDSNWLNQKLIETLFESAWKKID